MRVGVIGCGYWGAKHVRVLSGLPEVSQVVAIDRDPLVLADLKRTFPGLATTGSLDEALPLIDAAVVATPPRSHGPLGLTLLRAGKHVLVEKPMATSVADAEELIEVAEATGLTLMAGHTFEYSAEVRALRRSIVDGELGTLHYIDTARLNLGLYQSDVNVIWDLAPHDVSIVNHLLGGPPARVSAWGRPHAHARLEDVAYLSLEYPDQEVTAHVHVSWLDPCKVRRVTVVGSRSMVVYNDLADETQLKYYDKGVVAPDAPVEDAPPMSYRRGGVHSPYISGGEPLRVEAEHFLGCIATGTPPLTDGRSGLAVVQVLAAAEESLRTGRAVPVSAALAVSA